MVVELGRCSKRRSQGVWGAHWRVKPNRCQWATEKNRGGQGASGVPECPPCSHAAQIPVTERLAWPEAVKGQGSQPNQPALLSVSATYRPGLSIHNNAPPGERRNEVTHIFAQWANDEQVRRR